MYMKRNGIIFFFSRMFGNCHRCHHRAFGFDGAPSSKQILTVLSIQEECTFIHVPYDVICVLKLYVLHHSHLYEVLFSSFCHSISLPFWIVLLLSFKLFHSSMNVNVFDERYFSSSYFFYFYSVPLFRCFILSFCVCFIFILLDFFVYFFHYRF